MRPGRAQNSGAATLLSPGRARWGVSGSLNPTSAPAGPNAVRGTASTGSGLAHVASMVGFRALGASEPRQVRKEAALRIPSQVPRSRPAGAGDVSAPRGSLSKTERVTGPHAPGRAAPGRRSRPPPPSRACAQAALRVCALALSPPAAHAQPRARNVSRAQSASGRVTVKTQPGSPCRMHWISSTTTCSP